MPAPKQPARTNKSRPSRQTGRGDVVILDGWELKPLRLPPPADWWRPEVREWWESIANSPLAMLLLPTDVPNLQRLASMQTEFLQVRDLARREPDLEKRLKAGRMMIQLNDQCARLEREFGFTPLARSQGRWEPEGLEQALLEWRAQNARRPADQPPVIPFDQLGVSDRYRLPGE